MFPSPVGFGCHSPFQEQMKIRTTQDCSLPSLKLAGSLSWFHHLKAKVGLEPQTLPAPEDWPPFSNGVEVTLGM